MATQLLVIMSSLFTEGSNIQTTVDIGGMNVERYMHRYTSLRIHEKILERIEQIREIAGTSRNALMCAMLDKHSRVLLQDRDLNKKSDRKAVLAEVQQLLQEAIN